MPRPSDLYTLSVARQLWSGSQAADLDSVIRDAARDWFGAAAAPAKQAYLPIWMDGSPLVGRTSGDHFMENLKQKWYEQAVQNGPLGAGSLSGLVAAMLDGRLADRLRRPHRLAMLAAVCGATGWWILSNGHTPLAWWSFAVLRGMGIGATLSLLAGLAASSVSGGRQYASYSIFSALGFTVGAMLVPLAGGSAAELMRWAAGSGLAAAAVLGGLPRRPLEAQALVSIACLWRDRRFPALLLALLLAASGMPALLGLLPLHATALGATSWQVGLLIGLCAMVAIPAMPLVGRIIDRFGTRLVVVGALACWPLRCLVAAAASTPWGVVPAQLLHATTHVGLELAGPLRTAVVVPPQHRATAIALLGSSVGSVLSGAVADVWGYVAMYLVAVGTTAGGLLCFLFMDRPSAVPFTSQGE